jgi:hypothetical protein
MEDVGRHGDVGTGVARAGAICAVASKNDNIDALRWGLVSEIELQRDVEQRCRTFGRPKESRAAGVEVGCELFRDGRSSGGVWAAARSP